MVEFMQSQGSERKHRLFACACCQQPSVLRYLSERSLALVDAACRFAEGAVDWTAVLQAAATAPAGPVTRRSYNPGRVSPSSQAQRAVLALAYPGAREAAWQVYREGANLLGPTPCELLRCIFGNPFRPAAVDPAWLHWNSGTVLRLATAIYHDCAFERLPVLADALEEAGCTDAAILDHCRGPGPHVRGCWVVDLLLGKE